MKYYYEHTQFTGVISNASAGSHGTPAYISIKGKPYNVYVTNTQYDQLLAFCNNQRIDFELRLKLEQETGKIVSATMKRYELVSGGNFMKNIADIGSISDIFIWEW